MKEVHSQCHDIWWMWLALRHCSLLSPAAQFAGSVAYMSDSQEQLSKQITDLQTLLKKVPTNGLGIVSFCMYDICTQW